MWKISNVIKKGGMGRADFIEWIKTTFGSEVRQTPLMLLRSKLFLLSPAPHPNQS